MTLASMYRFICLKSVLRFIKLFLIGNSMLKASLIGKLLLCKLIGGGGGGGGGGKIKN
jgi:hypothetical protein